MNRSPKIPYDEENMSEFFQYYNNNVGKYSNNVQPKTEHGFPKELENER